MSKAARAELIAAIENDEIDNAAEYADTFARRHGLNPVSVRSTISRLRRELGKLTRASQRAVPAGNHEAGESARVNAVTLLKVADPTDDQFTRVAAAALIRYEHDEAFREAVDRQRPEIERIQDSLNRLRKTTADLLPEEREDFARLFSAD